MWYSRHYIATPLADSTARDPQLNEDNIDRRVILQILQTTATLARFLFSDPNGFGRVDLWPTDN